MGNAIKFGEIRKFVSRIDKISVCMKETLNYEIFDNISEVPEKYDNYYLIGFGSFNGIEIEPNRPALEIMLSEKPREDNACFFVSR